MMGDVMENLIGLGVSLAYVLAVLGASSLAARRGASSEATRKFVHIALGGWWLIAARFFDSPLWAAALPAAFILVNAFAYRRQKLSFMGRDGGEDTPGTVYYAVSLTALALFSFGIGTPYVGALGFFCMAFGDGFAAVLGKRFGRRVLVGCCGKTLVGSATMLAVSFASCAVVLMAPPPFGAGGILGAPGGAFAPLGSLAASLLAAALLAGSLSGCGREEQVIYESLASAQNDGQSAQLVIGAYQLEEDQEEIRYDTVAIPEVHIGKMKPKK